MQNQPTPSTAVNTLVELATNVANQQADPALLAQALEQRLEVINISREDFENKAEAMGEAFTIPNAALIERVQDCYDAYEQALRSMQSYLESNNIQELEDGCQRLIEITVPMTETVREYVKTLILFGPSPYPWMNAVRNALRSIVEQGTPAEALQEIVKEAVTQNEQAIAEVDASPLGEGEPYQAKRAAFVAVVAALKALKPVSDVEEIDAAVAPLQSAYEAMTAADEKIFAETTALKPTAMPAANVLINTARGALSGVYTLEVMEEALRWYKAYLENVEEQFDAAVEGETDSVVILEELPKTREIIDEHDEVIAELTEALEEEFTAETVEPILEDLIDVVERLHDSSQVYMDVAKREGKAICVACGHPNPPHNRVCEACGQKLPQLVDPNMYASSTFEMEERAGLGGDEEADGVVTENTLRLFEACYAFYEQKLSEEEFRRVINWSRATVETTDRALSTMGDKELTQMQIEKMTEEEVEAFEANRKLFLDSRQVLIEGMEDWSEGLDYLENYIETRHRPTIELGIQRIWVGSQKMYQVHKVGEIAERALADLEAEERAKAATAGAAAGVVASDELAEEAPIEEDETPYVDPELL